MGGGGREDLSGKSVADTEGEELPFVISFLLLPNSAPTLFPPTISSPHNFC